MFKVLGETELILPSGAVLRYDGSGKWSRRKPSILKDLWNFLRKGKNAYTVVSVSDNVVTKDRRHWFCESKDRVREVCNVDLQA
tara:strand:+ start:971 stop:1222 length:252 start_codon:yes stop_codon:yes gene_type:complete